jgi:tRNA dimethylallyltransferase
LAADRVRIICGPTAAGKSAIASALALEYGATILSADSRQIYRGFDIGTAKPDWSERKSIRYEGVDICDPLHRYSASSWAQLARDVIARNETVIVVGGTGFYIRALLAPLFAAPAIDPGKRTKLEEFFLGRPTADLRRWCEVIDSRRAHLGRAQLIRALETALLNGVRISDLHEINPAEADLTAGFLVVDPGAALGKRIESRVDAMIEAGWLSEVRSLDAAVPDGAPAWKASGYATMRKVVRGELDLSAARERIIIETRQYAKRQRTWFRHQLAGHSVTRLDPDEPDAGGTVERWWKETS